MAKVITFFGGDSQTGTTTLAISASKALSTKSKKVLLILASGEINEQYLDVYAGGLSSLLRLDKITKDDVLPLICKGMQYDYISGTDDITLKQFFDPTLLMQIRPFIDKAYDYIVVDAGHDGTLALPVSGLVASDKRFYVLSGSPKCVGRFQQTYQMIIKGLGLKEEDESIVLNKYRILNTEYKVKDIENVFGKDCITIPYVDNGAYFEIGQKTIYDYDAQYSEAVDRLTEEF